MLNQIKIIGLTLSYLALMGFVKTIEIVYPHVDQIAEMKKTSCG